MTTERDPAEVAAKEIAAMAVNKYAMDRVQGRRRPIVNAAAEVIREAYADQTEELTKLRADQERLLMRIREQTDYSQSVYDEIGAAVIKTLRHLDAIPKALDLHGHPIEQVVGTCLSVLVSREKEQTAELERLRSFVVHCQKCLAGKNYDPDMMDSLAREAAEAAKEKCE